MIEILYWIAGGCLTAAAILTLVRISRGPGSLDRVVGTDVLLAVVVGALAIEEAVNRHYFGLPIMLVVSLVAFIGTVAVARFVAGRRGAGQVPDADQQSAETREADRDGGGHR